MTDKEFDESIRRMCESVEVAPDAGGWDRIEKAMVRRSRVTWAVRGFAAAAVAAVVIGMFISPEGDSPVTAEVVPVGITDQLAAVQPVVVSPEPVVPALSGSPRRDPVSAVAVVPAASACEEEMPVADVIPGPAAPQEIPPSDDEQSSGTENPDVKPASGERSLEEQIREAQYLAYAEDEEKPKKKGVSIDASSDMYTLFGSGNVSFSRRNMSGGSGSSADFVIKPLNGEYPSHSFPISAGLGLRFSFGRFGIGTGVNYTYMKSSYEALVYDNDYYPAKTYQASVDQSLHYIGIPVTFLCDIITSDKLSFYASAGGVVEKGFGLKYRLMSRDGNISYKSLGVDGLQWSVDLGLGLEYRFLKFMGVYLDPRLTYYFYCDQPYSIRLEQPLQLNLNLGFRFHL